MRRPLTQPAENTGYQTHLGVDEGAGRVVAVGEEPALGGDRAGPGRRRSSADATAWGAHHQHSELYPGSSRGQRLIELNNVSD